MSESKETSSAAALPSPPPAPLTERLVVTEHKLKVGKRTLAYTATCGTLVLREDEAGKEGNRSAGKPRAEAFFIAYTLNHDAKAGD